jgi:tripartite-type tricarboxylate transporter receptor subunit TctC
MRRSVLAVAASLWVCAAATVGAQDYPAKPVRLYVGFVAGSGTDTAARLLAQRLDELTKQPFVVERLWPRRSRMGIPCCSPQRHWRSSPR